MYADILCRMYAGLVKIQENTHKALSSRFSEMIKCSEYLWNDENFQQLACYVNVR